MKITISLLLYLGLFFQLLPKTNTPHYSHQHIIEKMEVKWERETELIHFHLKAPTTGWLGIGFNDRNAIAQADLKMFRVINQQVESQDWYVVSHGYPQQDEKLGGTSNISQLSGKEEQEQTTISFTIDVSSTHYSDGKFDFSKPLWLIAAYSVSDDFGHHSIMRRHIQVDFSQ